MLQGVYDDFVLRGINEGRFLHLLYELFTMIPSYMELTGFAFFIFYFVVISSFIYESFTTILSYVELTWKAS